MGRPTSVQEAGLRKTQTQYEDNNRRVVVRRDLNSLNDGQLISVTDYDTLGRVRLTRQLENAGSQGVDDDTAGIKVQTRYLYSGSNRYQLTSNPYRESTSSAAASACSDYANCVMGWTLQKFDQDGRLIATTNYDGRGLPAPWGSNTSLTGTTTTAYDAETTTVTDPAGKARRSSIDGLGRLSQVVEAPSVLSYTTNYGYDALNNLTSVVQSNQSRTFAYTSLSRLSSATNPESGTTTYAYDNNGNVTNVYDGRTVSGGGQNVVYRTYDALNRVTVKAHNDGSTPDVNYSYDDTGVTYSKGRLTQVSAGSVSTTRYSSYDALGRVTGSRQTTGSQTYTFSYSYNRADALLSETYPSGRTINFTYDGANRPVLVRGTLSSQTKDYLTGVTYFPHGAESSYSLGNHLNDAFAYNSRLQMMAQTFGNANWTWYLMALWYDYGTTTNNGNVLVAGNDVYPPTQTVNRARYTVNYSYDAVNRVATAAEGSSWTRNFSYDAYGNMWVSGYTGIGVAGNTPVSNVFGNNRIGGGSYDVAGNQTVVNGDTITYDGEGRQTVATQTGVGTATYSYDGDGKRVQRVINGSTTVYVYDAQGLLTAEYSTTAPPTPACTTCFPATDALGSIRMVTDQNANIVARHDYLPFGEEVPNTIGGRTSIWGASDSFSQKFTGKERDTETGLDYFGARYYGSALGRFPSPDKPFADQHSEDPQSWNLYSYVRNNPLAHIDTDGQACFALNRGSAFCGRATEYGQIDARVNGQTRFFAAASAVSQALANSDIGYDGFISRLTPQISGSTQQFLGSVGQDLLQMNRNAAADIQSGKLSGPDLDARMVHMEQSKVEDALKTLEKKDPVAYKTVIAESNAGLNPTDRMRQVGSVYATDKAYLGVLDGVRKQLGRNIDFSKQSDREAIGNALIQHIRQKGGCDVTDEKVTVCQ